MNVLLSRLKEKQNKKRSERMYNNLMNRLKYSTGKNKRISLCVNTDKGIADLFERLTAEGYKCSLQGNKKEGWFITCETKG